MSDWVGNAGKSLKKFIFLGVVFLILGASAWVSTQYYSYLFSKQVDGEVIAIDRVIQPSTVIGMGNGNQGIPNSQIFSFAIAIRMTDGQIVTSSSEDRQWAVVEKGQCASARFYPYPPWEFEKAGTYYGARLLILHDCPNSN